MEEKWKGDRRKRMGNRVLSLRVTTEKEGRNLCYVVKDARSQRKGEEGLKKCCWGYELDSLYYSFKRCK